MRLWQQGFERDCESVAGADALRIALARRPDAVIADYNVPGLDIRDTIEAVLAADPDIPMIAVSGSMSADVGVELNRRRRRCTIPMRSWKPPWRDSAGATPSASACWFVSSARKRKSGTGSPSISTTMRPGDDGGEYQARDAGHN
jgi:CheY-like chemotaxis protein